MPCLLTRIVCLSGLLLAANMAIAADMPAAPERYRVELVVFRYLDQSRNTPEIPAASSVFQPSPLDLSLDELPRQPTQTPAGPFVMPGNAPVQSSRRPPIRFQINELHPAYPDFVPLRDQEHSLDQVYARLKRIDAYEPVLHVGWVQPARNTDEAKPYRIEPARDGETSGLAGTVTLYKGRFLHLAIDLSLKVEEPPVEPRFLFNVHANEAPVTYKLTESRRIRGTTAHYFDSPQFGVIARIQEVETAAQKSEGTG